MQRSTVIPRRLSTSGALATGLISGILVCSLAIPAAAQVVAQGAPAATTDAAAWPIKVLFGSAQIDPRDVSDRLARQVGRMVLVNSANTEIGTAGNPVRVDPTGTTTQPVSAASLPLPTGAATATNQTNGLAKTQITNAAGTAIAQVKEAFDPALVTDNALVVTPSPNGSAILMGRVGAERTATTVVASVAASASNVTCLTSNANRVNASVYNDSTADLFLKLGATASSSSYTAKIFADGYFRLPAGYTGIVDCIWSSATGNARTTEATP